MIGQRLPDGEPEPWPPPNGAYWRMPRRVGSDELVFSCMTPNGLLGNLSAHDVTEHEDGTITVSPSILVYAVDGAKYAVDERTRMVESYGDEQVVAWERGRPTWHGYLERGVWREC